MPFVQVIEFKTSRLDEGREAIERYRNESEGERTVNRAVLCKDRDAEDRYFNIVFFDSYEEAMANSEMPSTQALAAELAELADGPPTFYNLDVVDDMS